MADNKYEKIKVPKSQPHVFELYVFFRDGRIGSFTGMEAPKSLEAAHIKAQHYMTAYSDIERVHITENVPLFQYRRTS